MVTTKGLYPLIASYGFSDEIEELIKKFWYDKRYQIDGHLKRLKFVRVWGSVLPNYCLNSNDRQGAPPPTQRSIGLDSPRLHDDAIAIKNVKKSKFSSYRING